MNKKLRMAYIKTWFFLPIYGKNIVIVYKHTIDAPVHLCRFHKESAFILTKMTKDDKIQSCGKVKYFSPCCQKTKYRGSETYEKQTYPPFFICDSNHSYRIIYSPYCVCSIIQPDSQCHNRHHHDKRR